MGNEAVTGIEMAEEGNLKKDGRRNYRSADELARIRSVFIDWVQHILDQKNWTATDLANHSDLAASTLLRIMNSKTHPFNISFMTIRKVADGSGYPVPKALMEAAGIGEHALPKEELQVKPRPERARTAAKESGDAEPASHRMLKVRFVPSFMIPAVFDIPDTGSEPCPPQLVDDQTAFAARMPDDSLAPIVRKDMLLYFTKRRNPAVGDIFFVVDKEGRKSIRHIAGIDEDGIHLERLAPDNKAEVFAFDRIEDFGVCEGVWRR